MKKKIIAGTIASLFFLVAILSLFMIKHSSGSQARAISLQKGTIVSSIRGSGVIQSKKISKIYSSSTGIVQEVLIKEGDRVRIGTPLLKFDNRELMNRIQEAKLQCEIDDDKIKTLQEQLDAKRPLVEAELMPLRDFKELESNIQGVKLTRKMDSARLESLQIQLSQQQCMSPQNGTVMSRFVDSGESVMPGKLMFEIADMEHLEVEVQVNERDAYEIRNGQNARINIHNSGNISLSGKITGVGTKVIKENGISGVKVLISLIEPSSRITLFHGNQIEVEIVIAEKQNVLFLPIEAIILQNNEAYVILQTSSGQERRKIHTGINNAYQIEVLDGITEKETVLLP